ncbi:MAG: D-glycero-beta-D-manno-heptose-7-phosphate kinase [Acidobacteria bacterium]|nr:D-glycero-beta-D-manno-heptose-7-phosphate kinase [Acidobacteriota bacterium]
MEITKDFKNINVLIVGDVMLDRYWWGSVERISPEAPVPILNLNNTTLAAGGAANVAANVDGLGAKPFLIGIVGTDPESELFCELLNSKKISTDYLYRHPDRPTTIKTRILGHNQQIVRVDQEQTNNISEFEEEDIWNLIFQIINTVDVIIVSDYGKGLVTKSILMRLINFGNDNDKIVLIDPKGKDYTKYSGATLLTPNQFELIQACNLDSCKQTTIEEAGSNLLGKLSLNNLLVTQGGDGMTLFRQNQLPEHLPALARNVYDVTGAGDTVIATLGVALASGFDTLAAAKLANVAAGLIVEQIGTTAITLEMLKSELN